MLVTVTSWSRRLSRPYVRTCSASASQKLPFNLKLRPPQQPAQQQVKAVRDLAYLDSHRSTSSSMQATEGLQLGNDTDVRSSVSKYYGETLQGSSDLKTSACCTAKAPPAEIRKILAQVPQEIISRYYGCGSPFPVGLQGSGLCVLDLGCGTGRDCYVCAALVGEKGFVTGLDMTDAQLAHATQHSTAWQRHLGYKQPNMRFVKGAIEHLEDAGIAAGSVDVIISNCVINLSPDKPAVLREAYRALAEGGEVFFSDVYCDRRLPADVRTHDVLLGECLGGALAINDFVRLCQQVGFSDPRVLDAAPIDVHDPQLRALLGDAAFYSVTFRLFKLPGNLEVPPQEDYGHTVTYTGSIADAAAAYTLDSEHTFAAGVPVRVSGNTAAMCAASWLAPHFKVVGSKDQHFGQFQATGSSSSSGVVDGAYIKALSAGSSTAGGGSCCPPTATTATAAGGCCPPKDATATTNTAAAAAGGSCCPPKGACGAAMPAAARSAGSSCCPPAPTTASASGGCCPPKQPAAAAAGGCCPPKQAAAQGSCCPPQQQQGGCCPPKQPATQGGCCPTQQQQQGGGSSDCCPPKQGFSGGCCPPAQPGAAKKSCC